MFIGEYHHSLDNKDRVIVPSRFRDTLKENYSERLFITRGLDKCLWLFTEEEWKKQENKFREASFLSADRRRFNRMFFSGAMEVAVDRQGRILIPAHLKEHAGITSDVVVIGNANFIEIWSKDSWKQFYGANEGAYEEVAERLFKDESGKTGGES